jgi:Tol biopolymer transport system component
MTQSLPRVLALRFALASTLAFCIVPLAAAQENLRVVGEPIRLVAADGASFVQPRWSPMGDRLAFTGAKYEGLWVAAVDEPSPRRVTDEPAAGFGFLWSADGEALLTRVARYEGIRRYNAVKVFEMETAQERQLTEYRTQMSGLPRWTDDGRVVLYQNGKLEDLDAGRRATGSKLATDAHLFLADGTRVGRVDLRTGALVSVATREAGPVLNLVASPDGSQVAYEVMGGNLIVMGSGGTGRTDLGSGHRPRWSPDGRWIVYTITEDDGHEFTASDLYAVRSDGASRARLTATPEALEMNPDWSPDGQFIAYDDRGVIHLLPVSEN